MVDMKFWKLYDFRISLYSTVFEVADYEFGYSGYQLKNGIECTSQFFEKNVIKLRKDHVFI